MLNDAQILKMEQSECSCGPGHRSGCGAFTELKFTLTPWDFMNFRHSDQLFTKGTLQNELAVHMNF